MPGRGAPAPPPPPRGPPPKPPPPPGPPRPPGRVPVPGPPRPPPGPPGPAGPRPPTGLGGMLLGLGRGPPGRGPPGRAPSAGPPGPGRPAKRGADGRGPPGAPGLAAVWPGPAGPASPEGPLVDGAPGWPGRGARGAEPMPVAVELNGLFPGRGPGRGAPWRGAAGAPVPAAGLPGVLAAGAAAGPGRGAAGRDAAAAAGSAVSGCACGNGTGGGVAGPERPVSAGACSVAGSGGALVAAGAAGVTGPGAGSSRRAAGLAGSAAAGAGAVAVAGARPLPPDWPAAAAPARPAGRFSWAFPAWAENASLSLRTTGASIVDDAERTNSPISWSLAITALLSTPNSFASSYTRTFATALPLLGPAWPDQSAVRGSACSVRRQPLLFIAACSSVAHRNLSLLSPALAAVRALCRAALSWQAGTGSQHRKISGQPAGTKRSRQAQRPREHPTALRPVKALLAGMQVRTPARHPR